MNRVSAANQTRSAGSYRTLPAFRRSTAFSSRTTSNSAFFAPVPRDTRTARPNNQRISRQTILSSIRPANHHRISCAVQIAVQPRDRVFGRHMIDLGLGQEFAGSLCGVLQGGQLLLGADGDQYVPCIDRGVHRRVGQECSVAAAEREDERPGRLGGICFLQGVSGEPEPAVTDISSRRNSRLPSCMTTSRNSTTLG